MAITTGILLFDDAEELDFAGPWEVFTMARMGGREDDRVVTIAQHDRPIRCAKGLRVLPDHTFADAPALDVLLVPGGQGTRTSVDNPVLLDWLRKASEPCTWVTSVCTGALLLHAADLARGRRVTTHWAFVSQLRERGDVTVLERVRWVRDGRLVTSAGVSAGIDMALWLVGQLHGADHARLTQRLMEYEPAPPYAAEV
jgi:transcriptional regulator GlxA family with amidase domain